MTNLENLSYFSKLYDLFDSNKPKEVPSKIQDVILFVKKTLVEYESENGYQDDIHSKLEMLKDLQRAFENAMTIDSGWGFCITNGRQKYQINLRPIFEFLTANDAFIGEMEDLNAIMQSELLTDKNVTEFKMASRTIRELMGTFDDDFADRW
jgi:hypothetical protein